MKRVNFKLLKKQELERQLIFALKEFAQNVEKDGYNCHTSIYWREMMDDCMTELRKMI